MLNLEGKSSPSCTAIGNARSSLQGTGVDFPAGIRQAHRYIQVIGIAAQHGHFVRRLFPGSIEDVLAEHCQR